jgi:membrane fusion protein (multidrug efflux system)
MNQLTSMTAASRIKVAGVLTIAAVIGTALYLNLASEGAQSTDDAYVEGNIVQVTPQSGGSVTMIAADNTDVVRAGQVLVQLNDADARVALERAEAQLARTVRQVRVQFSNATQSGASVTLRASELARAQADLARRESLDGSGAVSGEDVRHASDAVTAARAALEVAAQQLASARAMVDHTSIASHPDVQAAISQLRDAYLGLSRTALRAPVSGIIAKRSVQLGQRIAAGTTLMSIVPPEQMWVNANFKESQMHAIHVGQQVVLHADVYGKGVTYRGQVTGQDAGTGNAFSLLPPQNASGNWIKVVQRVPVRIALEPGQLAAHPLKLGLSMSVTIDGGAAAIVGSRPGAEQVHRTDIFSRELEQADQLAERIIAANTNSNPAAAMGN